MRPHLSASAVGIPETELVGCEETRNRVGFYNLCIHVCVYICVQLCMLFIAVLHDNELPQMEVGVALQQKS